MNATLYEHGYEEVMYQGKFGKYESDHPSKEKRLLFPQNFGDFHMLASASNLFHAALIYLFDCELEILCLKEFADKFRTSVIIK